MNNLEFAGLAAGLAPEVTFVVVSPAVTAAHRGELVGAGARTVS